MGHYKRSLGLPAERQVVDALIYIANELYRLNQGMDVEGRDGKTSGFAALANVIKEGFDSVCDHLTMIQP